MPEIPERIRRPIPDAQTRPVGTYQDLTIPILAKRINEITRQCTWLIGL
jgi:hypothetical protein